MSKTFVIKKDTKVSLRGRVNTSGDFVTLYLDWGSGENRTYEFLPDRIYNNPKSKDEEQHNEILLRKARQKLSIKNAELLNDSTQARVNHSNMGFMDFFEIYKKLPQRTGKPKKESTIKSYVVAMTAINEFRDLSKVKLKDIDERWIWDLRQHLLSSKLYINTSSYYLKWFGGVLKQAAKKGYIDKNPYLNVDTIGMEDPEVNYIFHEDLQKLKGADCPDPILKKAGLFASQTGLRSGDIKALKWKMITKVDEFYRISLKQEKTDKPYIVHFKQSLMDIIGPVGKPEELVFPKFKNNNLANAHLTIWFLNAEIKPRGYPDKTFTMHDFRHTFAITLGLNGANLYEISQMLGHRKIATTERHYARILDQMKTGIVDKLPNL